MRISSSTRSTRTLAETSGGNDYGRREGDELVLRLGAQAARRDSMFFFKKSKLKSAYELAAYRFSMTRPWGKNT